MSDEFYDEFSKRRSWWLGNLLQTWVSRKLSRIVFRFLTKPPTEVRIAEIGPGIGSLAVAIENAGADEYVGFEANAQLVSITQSQLTRGTVLQAALPHLPSSFQRYFHVVVAVHVLEHASGPIEARNWISAMSEIIESNGIIVIVSPDVMQYKSYFWDIDWSHAFPTTSRRIAQVGRDLGLEVVLEGGIRGGFIHGIPKVILMAFSRITPTRLLDLVSSKLIGRPLGTGLQSAVLWRNSLVVLRKPESN